MAYFIFLKYMDSLEDFRKILMSKFLLNLLQISKALVYSKIKLLFGKEFFLTISPIGPAASQPIRSFSPARAHFFFSTSRSPPPLSPLGLLL
jgi:hypothetical protein